MDMPAMESNELSERELDILKLVATGASNKEIAQKLFISSNTVKVHLRNIFTKIGAASRTEAAMYAVRTGLVDNPANQLVEEEIEDHTSLNGRNIAGTRTSPSGGEQGTSTAHKVSRWAPLVLLMVILGVIFIGWRLSPGSSLINNPTATRLPQNTVTPIPHWNQLAGLPETRSNLALLSFGNQIYAIAGLSPNGVEGNLDRYDPQTNTWVGLSPKLTPVYDAHAVVINGLIYMPGGRLSNLEPQPTNILEIYDTNTDQWKTGARLPIPLSAYGLVAYEGQLYLFGGWDGKNYQNRVFSYDPTEDSWLERTPMTTARAFLGATEALGKIYVMGGIYNDQPVTVNEIYTPSRDHEGNNPWELGFPLPENRLGIRSATIADTIYVFGGESPNRVGLIYFPQLDVWQSLEPSPSALGDDFGLAAISTNLFFVGGKSGSTYIDQNITYQAIITLSIPIIIR
jgi:DNA-binding CsgD family transcriptional regulator